jgi:GT2 family glycosyltransferase
MAPGLIRVADATSQAPPTDSVPHLRLTGSASPQPALAAPRLSVVIVNFCQWRNTYRLVKQLYVNETIQSGNAEIVVVDNHSPQHQALTKLRRTEGVSVRRFSRNRGFARAVNEGCRLGRGGWVLLLNPDMSVSRGFLDQVDEISRKLDETDPEMGVVGFRLRHQDGSPQGSSGPFPSLFNTIFGLFLPRSSRKCRVVASQQRVNVPWVTGCCLLIRRECLEDLDGFDEDFFVYYEDVDLCRRAKEKGWGVCYEPALEVTHHTPLHLRSVPAPLRLMTRHALLTYSRKHWTGWQSWLLGKVIWFEALARQVKASIGGRFDESRFHGELRKLVGDVMNDRTREVRRRIRLAATYLENSSAEQDGKSC